MSRLHNALTRGAISDALKRAVGDTRSQGGVERYSETLEPVLDLWSRPEWAILRDEILWGGASTQAAVAGELSFVAVINPLGSGMLTVSPRPSLSGNKRRPA